MTKDQVLRRLRAAIWEFSKGAGRQRRFAASLGISPSFLSAVLNGSKEPTESICKAVGIERVIIPQSIAYRRKAKEEVNDV